MFSLMRAVLWRPLPYPEPGRIVVIQADAHNVLHAGATRAELIGIQQRARCFEEVATIDSSEGSLESSGEAEEVSIASVSDAFLPLFGVRPVAGRLLDSRLDLGNQEALAILISGDLWRRRFAADPGVIGRAVRIGNAAMRIAGVLPPGFRLFLPGQTSGLDQIDVWMLQRIDPAVPYRGVPLIARLKPGVTLQQANAELDQLAAQFERENPEFYSGSKGWMASPFDRRPRRAVRFTARPLQDAITSGVRPALVLLSCAVAFVLLIACVNAANLMLARGSARQREFQIRRALGAAKTRIVCQLLSESLVLAVASSAAGLAGARFGLEAIRRIGAAHIPFQSRLEIDAPVALFAAALAAVTSVLCGLVPALRLASGKAGDPLRAGRSETTDSGARGLQRILAAAEVALSIAPLAGAGLMLRSFVNLSQSPLGFQPANVITARIPLDVKRYPNLEQRWSVLRDIVDRIRPLSAVESVSAADHLPLAGQETRRVGRADQPDAPPILATQQFALPGYLGAIGTPLVEGRDFTDGDIAAERSVTIIDEGLAKRLWPEGAIGKRLSVFRTGWRNDLEIIGVTAEVRTTRVRDGAIPHFMMPFGTYPPAMSLVVKTRQSIGAIAPRIQSAVAAAHTGGAAFDIRPMSAYVADSIGDTRFTLFVLSAFALASTLLAALGLYATLAYLTAQRTREFGIRLALGSGAQALVGIVIRESAVLAAAGAAFGLLGVTAVTRAIRDLLYGVRPLDSITLSAVAALVALIAVAAAAIPAWRATRIDPQTSLRTE